MSVRTLKLLAGVFMGIAIGLVVIWLLQEAGLIDWLDDPATGAIGPAIIGMMLGLYAKKKDGSPSV